MGRIRSRAGWLVLVRRLCNDSISAANVTEQSLGSEDDNDA
jgi:hypothetical protein